jgi:hypothetical protein
MKFRVHYGRNFFGRQTGKQLAADLEKQEFILKNPEARVVDVKPGDKSVPQAPYFNHGLGRPYDGL